MTSSNSPQATIQQKTAHPIVFMFLLTPFGAMSGYLVVTLGFLLTHAGISPTVVAGLIGLQLLPQMLKFLWSPLVDVTLSVKGWHIISTAACAVCVIGMSVIPIKATSLPLFGLFVVISSVASSFVGIATNSLSAHNTPDNFKGRVSGYLQAGNLGGQGIGGGAGLWLSQHMANWMSGSILAIAFMLCSIFLVFVKEPVDVVKVKSLFRSMGNLGIDVWETIKKTGRYNSAGTLPYAHRYLRRRQFVFFHIRRMACKRECCSLDHRFGRWWNNCYRVPVWRLAMRYYGQKT